MRSLKLHGVRLNKLQLLVATIIVGVVFATIAVRASSRLYKGPAFTPAAAGYQDERPKSEIKAVVGSLTKDGFEPREITRPKGSFVLAVSNQSQIGEELVFSLDEDRGNKIREVKLGRGSKPRWNSLFNLSPGRYQLTVTNHPEWICFFGITEK